MFGWRKISGNHNRFVYIMFIHSDQHVVLIWMSECVGNQSKLSPGDLIEWVYFNRSSHIIISAGLDDFERVPGQREIPFVEIPLLLEHQISCSNKSVSRWTWKINRWFVSDDAKQEFEIKQQILLRVNYRNNSICSYLFINLVSKSVRANNKPINHSSGLYHIIAKQVVTRNSTSVVL